MASTTADHWLRMQMQYDLWHASQWATDIDIIPFSGPDDLALA
jgi:plasmid maintenance system antidote protein VapI